MRQEQGLDALIDQQSARVSAKVLSRLLLDDLANVSCKIFGKTADEVPVLLADLAIIPGSLRYEMFDQRIDFTVLGEITNVEYFPLTYRVEGKKYSFHGRCSTIPKVCGVDLYLSKTYTEKLGDKARQHFSVSVKKLLKLMPR